MSWGQKQGELEAWMVTNWDECNEALRDMAEIDARVGDAAAVRDAAARAAQEVYDGDVAEDLKLRAELEASVEKFAKRKRKEICDGKKKSKELTFGEIAFRSGRAALQFLKGFDEAKALEAIKEKIKGAARKALVREKVSLDKTAAKKLDAATLESIGMVMAEGEETIAIKTFPERLGK